MLLALHLVAIEGQNHFKFVNASCIVLDPKVISVHACEAEGYSLNLSLSFNRRLYKPINVRYNYAQKSFNKNQISQVKIELSSMKGGMFVPMTNLAPIEWCSIVGAASTNVLIKMIYETLKTSMPQVVHACPYFVSSFMSFISLSVIHAVHKNLFFTGQHLNQRCVQRFAICHASCWLLSGRVQF
jgi:hypothetical protein